MLSGQDIKESLENCPRKSNDFFLYSIIITGALSLLIPTFVKSLLNIKKSLKPTQFMLQKVMENMNTVAGRNVRMVKDI